MIERLIREKIVGWLDKVSSSAIIAIRSMLRLITAYVTPHLINEAGEDSIRRKLADDTGRAKKGLSRHYYDPYTQDNGR